MSTDSASSVTQRIQSDVGMASDAGAELLREARAQLSASQIADARAWFDEVDADGGGTLDEDEVYEAMTRMLGADVALSRAAVDELFVEIDVDGSGDVDFGEFLLFVVRYMDASADAGPCRAGDGKDGAAAEHGSGDVFRQFVRMMTKSAPDVSARAKLRRGATPHDEAHVLYVHVGGLVLPNKKGRDHPLADAPLRVAGYLSHAAARKGAPRKLFGGFGGDAARVAAADDSPTKGAKYLSPSPASPQHDHAAGRAEAADASSGGATRKRAFATSFARGTIWNDTCRIEFRAGRDGAPPPSTLVLVLSALHDGLDLPLATVDVNLADDVLKATWREENIFLPLQPLPRAAEAEQYKEQKEADVDDDDDDGGGATLGVKVRSLGSKQLSSAGLSKLTGISATSVMRRVTGHRARQNSIDRLLHIPPGTTLGLAVLKNPTELPMIEAAWESRRAQSTKMMQLLERKWYVLSPNDRRVKVWDLVVIGALFYTSTVTPFEVAVVGGAAHASPLWFVGNLVDLVFFVDLCLQFFLGYFDQKLNSWIFDQRYIASRYVHGWFGIDLASIFPFEAAAAGLTRGHGGGLADYPFHLAQFLKLLRLASPRMQDRILSLLPVRISNQYKTLMKFACMVILLVHWVACGYCLVAQLEEHYSPGVVTWREARDEELGILTSLHADAPASVYFHAVEFSIFAMVLTYSRAAPTTLLEQLYAIGMLLIMGCVYTYAIGAVCGILATMDPASTEYRAKRDLIRTWSDEMCASAELKEQLLEYMEECRLVIRQRYYHGLLDTLSPMLQQKVAQHQHSGWLTRVAFFQCEDRAERRRFTMTIATQIHQVMFVSREIIASAGERADCMYTIAKGVVALSSGHVMSVKRYFGEEMLLRCGTRPWSANAVTFVTLNVLKKDKLVRVLASGNFPHTAQTVRRWVVRRAFARVVRWLVHLRRARPGYEPLSPESFKRERQWLLDVGRDRERKQELMRVEAERGVSVRVPDAELEAVKSQIEQRERLAERQRALMLNATDEKGDATAVTRADLQGMQAAIQGLTTELRELRGDSARAARDVAELRSISERTALGIASLHEVLAARPPGAGSRDALPSLTA